MAEHSVISGEFRKGLISGFPVFLSYFIIALSFGILAKNTAGLSLGEAAGMSAFVFAGASQFAAVNMIAGGLGYLKIILAVFFINLRHFLMSASVSERLAAKRAWLPVLAFGITDETFAVATGRKQDISADFLAALELSAYSGWVGGTVGGFFIGEILPPLLRESFALMLYSLFIALLVPRIVQSLGFLLPAVLAALIHSVLRTQTALDPGWSIIAAIICGAAAGTLLKRSKV
jgi:4-azaleucine resistance transporter AzlC